MPNSHSQCAVSPLFATLAKPQPVTPVFATHTKNRAFFRVFLHRRSRFAAWLSLRRDLQCPDGPGFRRRSAAFADCSGFALFDRARISSTRFLKSPLSLCPRRPRNAPRPCPPPTSFGGF